MRSKIRVSRIDLLVCYDVSGPLTLGSLIENAKPLHIVCIIFVYRYKGIDLQMYIMHTQATNILYVYKCIIYIYIYIYIREAFREKLPEER